MLASKEVKQPVKPIVSKANKNEVQGIKRPDNFIHSPLFLQRYVGNSALQPPPTKLQRQCACKEDTLKLQRQAVGEQGGFEAPLIVHEVLRSPGQPLDEQTRAFMEPRFGYDFGRVRVHTDDKAAESAQAVNARAYTVGHHVVMRQGEYAPETDVGRRLLAHELVHVVQQGRNNQLQRLQVGAVGDIYEQEADQVVEEVVGMAQPTDRWSSLHFTHPMLADAAKEAVTGVRLKQPITPRTLQLQKQDAPEETKEEANKKFRFSSGLEIDQKTLTAILVKCSLGELDPVECVNLRMEVERSFQLANPFAKIEDGSQFGIPSLELGKKKSLSQVPSYDEMRKKILPELSYLPEPTPQQPPANLPEPIPKQSPAGSGSKSTNTPSGLPDIGISKLTTHEFDIRIGTLKITLPKSVEIKFNELKILPGNSIEISVKGEITELEKLFDKTENEKALGPPVSMGLSVKLNSVPHITIEATSSYDFSNKALKSSLMFKLLGQNCQFVIPKSAIDKIHEVEKVFQKYTGNAQTLAGDKIEIPPDDVIGQALEIAENIDKLYQAIKEIDDAKKKCQQTPTLELGPQIITPIGSEEQTPNGSPRKPSYGVGIKFYW